MANDQYNSKDSSTGGFSNASNTGGQTTGSAAKPQRDNSASDWAAASMPEAVKETGKSVLDKAKETAGQAYDVAAEKATTKLDEQKTALSDGLATVADSVRKVGENLQGSDAQGGIAKFTAESTTTAAQKIEQAAKYFESKDVKDMYHDVENFARQNPAIFIGGAFVLGILAARFIKSSSPKQLTKAAGANFGSDRSFDEGSGRGSKPSTGIL